MDHLKRLENNNKTMPLEKKVFRIPKINQPHQEDLKSIIATAAIKDHHLHIKNQLSSMINPEVIEVIRI